MLSNSDSIFQVLTYIESHPKNVIISNTDYTNAVRMFIDDTVAVGNAQMYFPDHEIVVTRMSPDFISTNSNLLDYFYDFTKQNDQSYDELWVTTGHLQDSNKYMVELSFE